MSISFPSKLLSMPFAFNNAGLRNNIPIASAAPLASYNDGFPVATMTPLTAGGVPPEGQDFNGILYDITQHIVWMNAGGQYTFNAALAALIGGYPAGAVLQNNAGTASYISLVANNTTDFNATPSSIGTQWGTYDIVSAFRYQVPLLAPYGSNPVTSGTVGDTPVANFSKSVAQSLFFTMPVLPTLNPALVTKLRIRYTTTVAAGNCYMQLGYQAFAPNAALSPAAYTNLVEAIAAPATAGNMSTYQTAVLVIPVTTLVANGWVNLVLTRLATNGSETNTGILQIVDITMEQ